MWIKQTQDSHDEAIYIWPTPPSCYIHIQCTGTFNLPTNTLRTHRPITHNIYMIPLYLCTCIKVRNVQRMGIFTVWMFVVLNAVECWCLQYWCHCFVVSTVASGNVYHFYCLLTLLKSVSWGATVPSIPLSASPSHATGNSWIVWR